ncbi:trypco2 family protein [Deinococcus sp. NW-56]|uniref:trypco2 family protein n=1 Tax=Deinococcus sp. NW-56 TaxID=2080419 RepID=UPI001319E9BE|nr:trypco2 family protein [Deinococcus sp. NW-56]
MQAVRAAIAQNFGREGRDGNDILRVQQVDLEQHTALTRNTEGELMWSVIILGGNYARSQQQTLSLS